ncbi:MAG: hypothetical protein BAJALOKI1v1_90013 [Promethearchaeota archaeon]|nr:MAG: hypothetical protein BAJALOKI1v1_90013 [Candidatus Lokiarchaeota archaeon]
MQLKKRTYKVVFIGPYYTGFFINSSTLIDKGYTNIQAKMLTSLKEINDQGWFIEMDNKEDVLWDVEFSSMYGGTTMIPASFLGRVVNFTDNIIVFEQFQFTIVKVLFFYHDYGVGTFRVKVEVNVDREIEVSGFRQLIEQFSAQLGNIINPLIEKDTLTLKSYLEKFSIPLESYEQISEELKEKHLDHIPIRSSLWFHRVFHFYLEEKRPVTEDDYLKYKDVLYSSQMDGPKNCSLNEYAQVYPSFNFSLFLYHPETRPKDICLNRVLEIAEYYYAATSLLDTILFNEFAKFARKKEYPPKIKKLEDELKSLKNLSSQLDLFLLTLKDSIINLSPSSILMWRNIDREWYYTSMLETLKEKSNLLTTQVNETLDELNQKRAQILNRFVKIFTLLAIIGPALEIYVLIQDLNIINLVLSHLGIFLSISIPIVSVIIILFLYYTKKLMFDY